MPGQKNDRQTGGLHLGLLPGLIAIMTVYRTGRSTGQQFNGFPSQSPVNELEKYQQLLASGAITEAEYHVQNQRF